MINSIGGLSALIPVLEYAGKSEDQRPVDFTSTMTPSPGRESNSEDLSEEWEVLPNSCFSGLFPYLQYLFLIIKH